MGRCGCAVGRPRHLQRAVILALHLDHEVMPLPLRDPFRIARSDHGAGHVATTLIVELRDDRFPGVVGVGEGFPDRFYGESVDTMAAVLPALLAAIGEPAPTPDGLASAGAAMDQAIAHNGAAKCALDIALHDLVGKVLDQPITTLLGLTGSIPPTDFTLGLDEPAIVAERARRAASFPALKIKVGGPADIPTLEAVRAVYDGPIRVDANTGWQPDDAVRLLPALERLGVELIEQPSPARRLVPPGRRRRERRHDPRPARPGRCRRRHQREAREVWWHRAGPSDARGGTGARLPDVRRMHGGDVGGDRRLGGRRVARGVGRPRWQPAVGGRPVRGARARPGLPMAIVGPPRPRRGQTSGPERNPRLT